MYTAKLKNRVIESGIIRWVVEFTNGSDTFSDSFKQTKYSNLQIAIANKLAELNFVDTFTIDANIDSTVPVEIPLTQAEIARKVWMNDWRILKVANELISNGVIVNTLPVYVAHKQKVSDNFKVAYIPFL